MMNRNEEQTALAFTRQAEVFDDLFSDNTIVQYKRKRVRALLGELLPEPSNVLELNSGTGEDALWLASQGHTVHATDIAPGMQQVLHNKVKGAGLAHRISQECCSFTQLQNLKNKGPYQLIFSNFAGLNCTDRLGQVLLSLEPLLQPNGLIVLVVMPSFCLWETALFFNWKFRTAFRRFSGKKGTAARVEGHPFTCWYYNPSFIKKTLRDGFEVMKTEGLCSLVPPSYLEGFAEKHPALYRWLRKKEAQLKSNWPWRQIGDYYIIVLRKKINALPHYAGM